MKVKKKNQNPSIFLATHLLEVILRLAIGNFLHLKSAKFGPFMKNPLCKSKSYFSGQNLAKIRH